MSVFLERHKIFRGIRRVTTAPYLISSLSILGLVIIFSYLFLGTGFSYLATLGENIGLSVSKAGTAGSALLSWQANTEGDIAGYRVYYGTQARGSSCPAGGYANSVDVGNVTTRTIVGLTEGQTYYFSITAYDTSGNESCFSNQVSKVIPGDGSGLASGLIAHLQFNESSGTHASDASGGNHHGSVSGAWWTAGGYLGGALQFDGTDDHVALPDIDALDATNRFTIAAWIKPDANSQAWGSVLSKHASQASRISMTLGNASVGGASDDLFVFVGNGSNSYGYTTNHGISFGVWQHVAMVFDGTAGSNAQKLKLYINGNQQNLSFSGAIPSVTPSNSAPVTVGLESALYPDTRWRGLIDDVRLYTAALAPAEVSLLASASASTCGNNVLESHEQCDGSNFGGATCVSQGYASGTLGCSVSCTFNTIQCVAPSFTNSNTSSNMNNANSTNANSSSGGSGTNTQSNANSAQNQSGSSQGTSGGGGSAGGSASQGNQNVSGNPLPSDNSSGASSQGNTALTQVTIDATIARERARARQLNAALRTRLLGYILLQVEEHGEAWYLDGVSKFRYYLANGPTAYQMMRRFGLGITNADLNRIPVGIEARFQDVDTDGDRLPDKMEEALGTDINNRDTDGDGYPDGDEIMTNYSPLNHGKLPIDLVLSNRLKGRILLQVEERGQAWYVHPQNGKRYYMKDGEAAYQIMRFLSLGILNSDLEQLPVGE